MLYYDQDEAVSAKLGHVEIFIFDPVVLDAVEAIDNIQQKDGPVCQKAVDRKV